MQRKLSLAVVGVLGFALALSACGVDEKSGDDGDKGGSGSGDTPSAEGKIGVILPDTESSVRWESSDRPELEKAFEAAGVEYDIQNAEGDAEKMTTIADGMIADGVTVLAIVNLDSESGAAIEEKAASQGVKTIDYDRLTLGGELNKLAANVAMARNFAGIHWRTDYTNSILLGEEVAIRMLMDLKMTYNEDFQGYTFTKFDGTRITV